jgi:hypothetical protein
VQRDGQPCLARLAYGVAGFGMGDIRMRFPPAAREPDTGTPVRERTRVEGPPPPERACCRCGEHGGEPQAAAASPGTMPGRRGARGGGGRVLAAAAVGRSPSPHPRDAPHSTARTPTREGGGWSHAPRGAKRPPRGRESAKPRGATAANALRVHVEQRVVGLFEEEIHLGFAERARGQS